MKAITIGGFNFQLGQQVVCILSCVRELGLWVYITWNEESPSLRPGCMFFLCFVYLICVNQFMCNHHLQRVYSAMVMFCVLFTEFVFINFVWVILLSAKSIFCNSHFSVS